MSLELYYASAPRGLKPGSRGFCTVARSDGMQAPVVERLESLSNYEPLFAQGPAAEQNPVAWSHWRIPVGTRSRSVLSRVAFVQADYTGRPGKFAHHVLLETSEQHPAGPAWVIRQPGVMREAWVEEPRLLQARAITAPAAQQTDDPPDWSRALADAFLTDAARPAYVIYRPGADLLGGLHDALAMLPPQARWQVTFNTYYTELPAGLACAWRLVVADTPAGRTAARSAGKALVLDLTGET